MTQRERSLLVGLLGTVGVGIVALAIHAWFFRPLAEHNDQLEALQKEV